MNCVEFGFGRSRGFGSARGQFWPIAIDRPTRPYSIASTAVQQVMAIKVYLYVSNADHQEAGAVSYTDVRSYRPISNLSVASKMLQRIVAKQFIDCIQSNGLHPDQQSAYRSNISTETAAAILRVMLNILQAVDVAVLTQLYLSATFDTVDHCVLMQILGTHYYVSYCVSDCRFQHDLIHCGQGFSFLNVFTMRREVAVNS
jgi:Reverse transcriptase (RNA-dependent DNA polymerase)